MRFLLLLLLACTAAALYAQPDIRTRAENAPLGIEDAQEIDQLLMTIEGIGTRSREDLERQNIKPYMMPVRQATNPELEWAYMLAGALEYYININQNYKDNLSPDLIALSLAAQGTRPTLLDGLEFLRNAGTVSSAIVPYGSSTIPTAVYSVPRRKISNFGYLFRSTTRARTRIFETRKALSRGNPVLIELSTGDDFSNWSQSTYTGPNTPSQTHYLLVVGYDETLQEFELLAAKGRHWGRSGYVRLSYSEFGRLAMGGYVLFAG